MPSVEGLCLIDQVPQRPGTIPEICESFLSVKVSTEHHHIVTIPPKRTQLLYQKMRRKISIVLYVDAWCDIVRFALVVET